jgi:hypothetical protein
MRTVVTSQGSAYGRLRRALDTGNPTTALAAAAELDYVSLPDALKIVLLLVEPKAREPAKRLSLADRLHDVRYFTRKKLVLNVQFPLSSQTEPRVSSPPRLRPSSNRNDGIPRPTGVSLIEPGPLVHLTSRRPWGAATVPDRVSGAARPLVRAWWPGNPPPSPAPLPGCRWRETPSQSCTRR